MGRQKQLDPQLGWIHWLTEVGRPIRDLADQEVRLLVEIADLQAAITAKRKALKAHRAKARKEVATTGWTDADVRDALDSHATSKPFSTCTWTRGCPLTSGHGGDCCPPRKAVQ